jgi:hypothetical protein
MLTYKLSNTFVKVTTLKNKPKYNINHCNFNRLTDLYVIEPVYLCNASDAMFCWKCSYALSEKECYESGSWENVSVEIICR